MTRPSGPQSAFRRRLLNGRAEAFCARCGNLFAACDLEANHVESRFDGGTDAADNGELLCRPCHKVHTRQVTRRYFANRRAAGRKPAEANPGVLP